MKPDLQYAVVELIEIITVAKANVKKDQFIRV